MGAGGPYANLFDNAEDTLTLQRVQCFDFEGLDKYPLLLAPLLFYVSIARVRRSRTRRPWVS